jgi:phosphoribosylglycinamide formyltransferase 1
MARIAVLASGEGTNLQALIDDPEIRPWLAVVVSDSQGSGALRRAERAGIRTVFLDPKVHADRASYGRALLELLRGDDIEYVVLAGFMRILSAEFVRAFDARILNVHPALLPAFPGAHAVRDALEWGTKVTGVTVHFVDEEVDHGPIVFQEPVEVGSEDDWASLESRIHETEHRLLPRAVRLLAEGRLKVEGRLVHVLEGP